MGDLSKKLNDPTQRYGRSGNPAEQQAPAGAQWTPGSYGYTQYVNGQPVTTHAPGMQAPHKNPNLPTNIPGGPQPGSASPFPLPAGGVNFPGQAPAHSPSTMGFGLRDPTQDLGSSLQPTDPATGNKNLIPANPFTQPLMWGGGQAQGGSSDQPGLLSVMQRVAGAFGPPLPPPLGGMAGGGGQAKLK